MRIAIFGTGGAGGYFGARLAQAGEDVSFVARGPHLRAIREHGLSVKTPDGTILIHPASATDRPDEVGVMDVVLVGVKTWQIAEAAAAMKPMLGDGTCVLPLQNGVEAAPQLAAALGARHVLGGLCGTLSRLEGPGVIRSIGSVHMIKLGELDGSESERTKALLQVLRRSGVNASIPENIHVALWEKFLFVVPAGGIGAVSRAPIGTTRSLPETRRLLEQAMREIYDVARARNIALSHDVIARTMAFVDTLAPEGTTSLQRDIADGKPSELEAWNGAVVRLGREAGVPTPLHEFIYDCLLPLERQARGEIQFAS